MPEEECLPPDWGWEDRERGRRVVSGSEASGQSCWREGGREALRRWPGGHSGL